MDLGNVYIIQRRAQSIREKLLLPHEFECKEETGKPVFTIRANVSNHEWKLEDTSSKIVGTIHYNILSLNRTFEFYDDSKLLGKMKLSLLSSSKGEIEDDNGSKIATIKGSNFDAVFEIRSIDGSTEIAKFSTHNPKKDSKPAATEMKSSFAKFIGEYKLEILDQNFSKLFLIELTIASNIAHDF